jgi:hypothetical protein
VGCMATDDSVKSESETKYENWVQTFRAIFWKAIQRVCRLSEGRGDSRLKELEEVIWPLIAQKTSEWRKKKIGQQNDCKKQVEPLAPGTRVMARDQTRESKWDPRFEGPFIDADGKELERRMTIDMLRPLDAPKASGGRNDGTKEGEEDGNSSQVLEDMNTW